MSDWTAALPILASDVRAYLTAEGTSGAYDSTLISSNIRAAASFLQRQTMRQIMEQNAVTKKFTTDGKAYIAIPDLRTVTSVALQGATLTADASYWLIPDSQHSGVYIGAQFRAFGQRGDSYLGNPEWFDRNLDFYQRRGYSLSSLPNDLSITGNWGWQPYPNEFLHACKVLAAFYTKRPASVLSDSTVTPEGFALSYSQHPIEVRAFIENWRAGSQLVMV